MLLTIEFVRAGVRESTFMWELTSTTPRRDSGRFQRLKTARRCDYLLQLCCAGPSILKGQSRPECPENSAQFKRMSPLDRPRYSRHCDHRTQVRHAAR